MFLSNVGFLRDNFELFKEALRYPYTKLIIPLIFSCTVFFALGYNFIASKLAKKTSFSYGWYKVVIMLTLMLTFLPLFKGNLVFNELKVSMPDEYLHVFEYFKNEPKDTRIANLPQPTFWGWSYTKWGYRGSGFLWYGIEQPITDRAFDVWNYKNEQFYNEFQYAIYSENPTLLKNILQKYQINYLLLDKNVITPGSPGATFYPQTILLLAKTSGVELDKSFGNIDIYKVKINNEQLTINNEIPNRVRNDAGGPVQSYVYAPDSFNVSDSTYDFSNADSNFGSNTINYIEGSGGVKLSICR
jgi:hypothetical protein